MNELINMLNNLMSINEFNTFFKLILIVILSGIVGYEREAWNKPAGFRTHVLVGISATLVMICGDYIYITTGADPTRIPAQLLSGIGFLGAGTILKDGFNVRGLTTAAGLLAVTCIGLAVGAGYFVGAIIATIVVFLIIKDSHNLSDKLDHYSCLELSIVSNKLHKNIEEIKDIFEEFDMDIVSIKMLEENSSNSIRISSKYRMKINKNDVISRIAKLEGIEEIVEVLGK